MPMPPSSSPARSIPTISATSSSLAIASAQRRSAACFAMNPSPTSGATWFITEIRAVTQFAAHP